MKFVDVNPIFFLEIGNCSCLCRSYKDYDGSDCSRCVLFNAETFVYNFNRIYREIEK